MRFAVLLLLSSAAMAANDFDGLTCDSDFAKALVGHRMSDAPVAALEKRYEKLRLKDLGADEPERGVTFVSWSICGDTVLALERKSVVVDTLRIAGGRNPAWSECTRAGATESLLVLSSEGRVEKAWKIDSRAGKFVAVDAAQLTCARS